EEIVQEKNLWGRCSQLELHHSIATAPEDPAQGVHRTPLFSAEAVGAGPQRSRGPGAGRDRPLGGKTGSAPPGRTEGDREISPRRRGKDGIGRRKPRAAEGSGGLSNPVRWPRQGRCARVGGARRLQRGGRRGGEFGGE